MSVTLAQGRREVAARTSEFLMGTATGGSTTTIVDANNLQYVDGYWAEQYVLFTSGTNNNLLRKVQTFTQSSTQATLYSAVTAAVVSGDSYELYRRFSPTDYKNAINAAINKGWPDFYVPSSTYVVTATHDTLRYSFPTTTDMGDGGLVKIEYQYYTLASQSTWPYQELVAGVDYEVVEDYDTTANAVLKTLQLRFNPDTNKLIRMRFGYPIPTVSADTDRIRVDLPDLEWVYEQAKAELWRIEAARSEFTARKDAIEERDKAEREAERLRLKLGHTWPPKPQRRTRFAVI